MDAHVDTSDRWLSHNFTVPGADTNGLTSLKTRWWSVSSFSIETEYTRALSLSTDKRKKELKDWFSRTWGLYLKKLTANVYLFHSFLWGTHSWYLSKYFRYTLYILLLMRGTAFQHHTNRQLNYTFPCLSIYIVG